MYADSGLSERVLLLPEDEHEEKFIDKPINSITKIKLLNGFLS
jgi:hypothetical protein